MTRIRLLLVTVITAGLISVPAIAAKSYYKWIDEDGVTHYTARKPHDQESEAISVLTGLPRGDNGQPIQLDDASTPPGAEQSAAEDPEANKDPERCDAAQKNLKILQENARIREKGLDGNFRYLSEEEKGQRKEMAEQAIAESC